MWRSLLGEAFSQAYGNAVWCANRVCQLGYFKHVDGSMCVNTHVNIYIYIYTHTHTHTLTGVF